MSVNPLNLLFGAAGALLKPFGRKKAPPPPMPLPVAQPGRTTAVLEAVAARRGSRANQRSGRGGAEPSGPGQKTQLGA